MKALLSIFLHLLAFNLVTAQSLGNKFCEDITSNVCISEGLNGKHNIQIILDQTDTLEFEVVESSLNLIGVVKNDVLINILCNYSKYNGLYMLSLAKNNNVWEKDLRYSPISSRYMGDSEADLIDFQFPDINTLLVTYKLSESVIVDRLYRFTPYAAIEYDCYGNRNSGRMQFLRTFEGKVGKDSYRPSN